MKLSERFADLPRDVRRRKLEAARLKLDWDAKDGPLGGVILHLRYRARAARRNGQIFLWMLVATVVLGLGFYLGLPLVQGWFDGRQQALEDTLKAIENRKQELDADRRTLILGGEPKEGLESRGLQNLLKDTFLSVSTDTFALLSEPIVFGGQLFVFGEGAVALTLDRESNSFKRTLIAGTGYLRNPIIYKEMLYVFDDGGNAHRLRTNESSFEIMPTSLLDSVVASIVYSDQLFLFDTEGNVARLSADNTRFEQFDANLGRGLRQPIVFEGDLYVFGWGGQAFRLKPGDNRFEVVATGTGDTLVSPTIHGERLYVLSYGGSVYRLAGDQTEFEMIATVAGYSLSEAISYDKHLFVFGDRGLVLKLNADSDELKIIPTGTDSTLGNALIHGTALWVFGEGNEGGIAFRISSKSSQFVAVPIEVSLISANRVARGDDLFVFGGDGQVARLSADGSRFESVATDTNSFLTAAILTNGEIFIFGSDGAALTPTNSLSINASKLPVGSDDESQSAVRQFFANGIPEIVRDRGPISEIYSRLSFLESERVGLNTIESRTSDQLRAVVLNPLQYLRERKLLELRGFLDVCRGLPPSLDLTAACITAWQSEQVQGQKSWWETLAAQVPPGILLLFLLATLGGLYRYNVRLASFHDSRADALQLLSQSRTPQELRDILAKTPGEAVNLATLFLAADKVEMGTIKAKLGQAEIELAKALGADKSEG
ncbi:hypothetical protein [Rhodobacter sp. SY28-1]|uniref:hypothetical protein n=1 Tax=Rhodobacter sp. SY28-1 TaxID=2562317 RepID=UPI0010BF71A2|nr:hypothetical protein [Rhodobacter sp. SY28-1]